VLPLDDSAKGFPYSLAFLDQKLDEGALHNGMIGKAPQRKPSGIFRPMDELVDGSLG
jgi:hypothetical protein